MADEPGKRRGISTRSVELVVALLVVVGGAVVIFDSQRLGASWASDGPQAGYVPNLIGWALALAGLWIAGSTVWKWRKLADVRFVAFDELAPVLTMLLPTVVYVALIAWIGLYVASALYIGAFMVWKGKYGLLPSIAVGVGVVVAAFLLFEVWFLVPLPKGPLEHLLGY
jgi:hypothetical protein